MTKKRKKEILKTLFANYVDKPFSQMDSTEKFMYLSQNITFQLEIRKRKITQAKKHKEIMIDEKDPTSWYFKR